MTAVLRAPAFRLSVAYKTGPMDTPKVAVPRNTATKHTEQSAHQAAIWVALEYAGQCLSKGSKVTLTRSRAPRPCATSTTRRRPRRHDQRPRGGGADVQSGACAPLGSGVGPAHLLQGS